MTLFQVVLKTEFILIKKLFEKYHLNSCDSHVDFMIGTKDLNITGITEDGCEVLIFSDGNFTEEFF